ncbi:acetoacetyl-CoA synthetase [Gemmatimonadetes bacterium T265]|nr:acetoacetyl-CoA synthetase [Gemmatimonadetes bacterium T265]
MAADGSPAPPGSVEAAPVWAPSAADVAGSNLAAFVERLRARVPALADLAATEYGRLHAWSVADPSGFWGAVWEDAGLVADVLPNGSAWDAVLEGGRAMVPPGAPGGARWFPGARLNYAENLLRPRAGVPDDAPALVAWTERGRGAERTWAALRAEVAALAAALRADGVGPGDRVAAVLPNAGEAVVAALAAASVGAVWSSCSPDFGADGVVDRFGQVEPAVLFVTTGYEYAGAWHDARPRAAEVAARLPSVRRVVAAGGDPSGGDPSGGVALGGGPLAGATAWADYLAPHAGAAPAYARLPFAHPLAVLYSSGTTGRPKGIVHSAGGTLLQHVKELALHTDLRAGDRLCYYTTTGWMMWNWQLSALALGCTLVLYDGHPLRPTPAVLWDLAAAERVAVFGTSARYLALLAQALPARAGADVRATHDLGALRAVLSTGSPLAPEGYDFVAERIKPGVRLSSISGGTDIVSCFALGAPVLPVWRGELQCLGLGMAVDVVDDDGRPLPPGVAGELVCRRPFPSMPVAFWRDPDGARYRAAYFDAIPGVWRHGDWAELTDHRPPNGSAQRGLVIHGRSDATLNVGGVRIGTAELYRQAEQVDGVLEALAVEQRLGDGVGAATRLVLFVRLAEGAAMTPALGDAVRARVRARLTAHHVPRVVVAVPDLPRTRNGKLSELAARDAVHGRPVKNADALANPEALAHFRDRPELRPP